MALVTARRTPVFSWNVSSVRSSITWPPSVSSSTRLIQACSPSARARVTARRKRIKSGPAALKADELTKVDRRRVVDEIKRDYTDAKQGLGAQVGVNGPRPRRVLRARGGTSFGNSVLLRDLFPRFQGTTLACERLQVVGATDDVIPVQVNENPRR